MGLQQGSDGLEHVKGTSRKQACTKNWGKVPLCLRIQQGLLKGMVLSQNKRDPCVCIQVEKTCPCPFPWLLTSWKEGLSASLDRAACLPQYPKENTPVEAGKKTKEPEKQACKFAYKHSWKPLMKIQRKDRRIFTLKGFLKYLKSEGQGFKMQDDWMPTSIPICFCYFCEHVLTSNCGWKCRKDAVCAWVWALELA